MAGRPLLYWSLRALDRSPSVAHVVVATAHEDLDRVRVLLREWPLTKVPTVCRGGEERADTVWNGIQALPREAGYVAVHDGARPLVRPGLIEAVIAASREHGAALPALPVLDTLKRSGDGTTARETVDRTGLFAVQTPQVFLRDWLEEAYRSAREAGFAGTDDAACVERAGHPVRLVPGDRDNIKITVPEDLEEAERLLRSGSRSRTGFGYDAHPLAEGRPLVLGGVRIPHPRGLEGHSDADVLLHAVCDALLGAACLGDIGLHFPNTEPRFKDASSLALLERVGQLVRDAGFLPEHVDVTLAAEAPKIAPHTPAMRVNIARALGIPSVAVNVKATTNERLGFVGREEGMAAWAVATVLSVRC